MTDIDVINYSHMWKNFLYNLIAKSDIKEDVEQIVQDIKPNVHDNKTKGYTP